MLDLDEREVGLDELPDPSPHGEPWRY